MIELLTLLAVVVFAYALLSRFLSTSPLTMPIFCVAIGLLAGPVLGIVEVSSGSETLVLLLEAALVMVLFADASGLDVRRWTREQGLSGRLLGLGLPLTMLVGAIVAKLLIPGLEWWQAGLIGVILAPTDAALGQAVVANPRVPAVVRNALNVESGLNDGLALPFVTLLIAVGEVAGGAESEARALETLVFVLAASIGVGLATGLGGGWLIRTAADRGLAATRFQGIALAGLAVAAFAIADGMAASGFLAVWIAGLCAGSLTRGHLQKEAFHLSEHAADILAAVGFTLMGVALLGPVLERATPVTIIYAVLSLTVARMLPVALVMLRSGFARPSVAYIGWFGPRGLASIVFAGLVVEAAVPGAATVTDVILITVALSIVAHGASAAWGARRYAGWFEAALTRTPDMPEAAEIGTDGVQAGVPRRVS
jgi:NhaP-type Na+/H+ or K+/H+ antiporter